MAFVDELTLDIKAGDGGDGVVRWRHEKFRPQAGPSGGDGGNGGDVYVVGVRDAGLLSKYKHNPKFHAEDGGDGMKDSLFGPNGEDMYLKLPVGVLLTNVETKEEVEIVKEGEPILLLRAGRGGRGNESYKSSVNRSPEQFTEGRDGEFGIFHVQLRLIADVGLVGFPNAGKSSLLNVLTNAAVKVGAYPFTTLEPSLGVLYGYVIADIPGLIEGAGTGKGLGFKFLRHIKRTKCLVHLVSFENEDLLASYKQVRRELVEYGDDLELKQEVIVLTKTDVTTEGEIQKEKKRFLDAGHEVQTLTLYDDDSVKKFQDFLIGYIKEVK